MGKPDLVLFYAAQAKTIKEILIFGSRFAGYNLGVFQRLSGILSFVLLSALHPALAWTPHPYSTPGRRVLDIQKLRVITAGRFPNDVPTCQALVIGGGLGGVAAAEDLADQGISVILTEPTSQIGGQLTAQGLGTPDENRYIDDNPGPGTPHYRALRTQVRLYYGLTHGIVTGRAGNVGQCWVSRISAEPTIWEDAIQDRLRPLEGPHGIRAILTRTQLIDLQRYPGNGRISYADLLNLDTGRITRIGAQYILDATETGQALAMAGAPWTIGQEAQSAYGEPDAPSVAHPDWIQSFTYDFLVRWTPPGNAPLPIVPRPLEYNFFHALGQYTLTYEYPSGPVTYKMLSKVPGAGGPFWTYRRLVAAASFHDNPAYTQDVGVINWRGNDYPLDNFIGLPPDAQVQVLARAKSFAEGFLYWLQTECPRDDGTGVGYPEIQPAGDELGGDGFAPMPYIRESRRLLAITTLTENALLPAPDDPQQKFGSPFPDSVGIALYNIDIHPPIGEPPLLRPVLPYEIPLGAFIARSGPDNILPAAFDIGASRLAAASARTHPIEWLMGEIAGHLAAFCLRHDVTPLQVDTTPVLLHAFQAHLLADGIPDHWNQVTKAFRVAQRQKPLALAQGRSAAESISSQALQG